MPRSTTATARRAAAVGDYVYRHRHYTQTEKRMARSFGLEVFKFCCYLSLPVGMTLTFAAHPGNLEYIIRNRAYVVYPPEGPKPPTGEAMHEYARKWNAEHPKVQK